MEHFFRPSLHLGDKFLYARSQIGKCSPKLRDQDYYDLFEESDPIDVSRWRTSQVEEDRLEEPIVGQDRGSDAV